MSGKYLLQAEKMRFDAFLQIILKNFVLESHQPEKMKRCFSINSHCPQIYFGYKWLKYIIMSKGIGFCPQEFYVQCIESFKK